MSDDEDVEIFSALAIPITVGFLSCGIFLFILIIISKLS